MSHNKSLQSTALRSLLLFSWIGLLAPSVQSSPDSPEIEALVPVPQGTLAPGASLKNINSRTSGDQRMFEALIYENWAAALPPVLLPEYWIGRYEVTNAQYKQYLDQFRKEHTTSGGESLTQIAKKYSGYEGEARAIFAFNLVTICEALEKEKLWDEAWGDRYNLKPAGKDKLPRLSLPKDLKLTVYAHRVPRHWYGWHPIVGLHSGMEWCDPREKPALAFRVPGPAAILQMFQLGEDDDLPPKFRKSRMRDIDFAAYPIRDVSIGEILKFVEWCGCDLPSEYEWERALRGGRDRNAQYPFQGEWNRGKDQNVFAWADNRSSSLGPMAVDDSSVARGDGTFGTRHSIGNVWEPTRTFFQRHPYVTPEPPSHQLYMFSLIAKGASWGDGWFFCQISSRAPQAGEAHLDIGQNHRADSLGIRLAKHPKPGHDLLRHTILRTTLTANANRQNWSTSFPAPAFALQHMGGVEANHMRKARSPYIHFTDKAIAIAAAPLWISHMSERDKKQHDGYKDKKLAQNSEQNFPLGILRIDVPFLAGKRLFQKDADKLDEQRKVWEEWKKAQKNKKKKRGKKKKDEPEEKPPPKPPAMDKYEQAVLKVKSSLHNWREAEFEPGEFIIVYWHGFIGLTNKSLTMPPAAILIPKEGRKRLRGGKGIKNTRLTLDINGEAINLEMTTEARPKKVRREVPTHRQGELWPLCETLDPTLKWAGWPKRKPNKTVWTFEVRIPVKKGALESFEWIDEKMKMPDPAKKAAEPAKKATEPAKETPEPAKEKGK
ncbi:MAG: SUMF1/EgtB/PvdO family nonheme iron enzyme [Planctomycetota bacterium]